MSIECEKNLKELADKETKATIYELLGDSCLAIQDTICAKEFYLKTLVIKDNCTTRMKLAIANATFTCCPLDKYVFAILKGDTYVRWKRYDEAISSYKEALSINDKQYPKQRIKTCEQMKKQKWTQTCVSDKNVLVLTAAKKNAEQVQVANVCHSGINLFLNICNSLHCF